MIVSNCGPCGGNDIVGAICRINKRLSQYGQMKQDISNYGVKRNFDQFDFDRLITYKEILTKKLYDVNYSFYSLDKILSRVNSIVHVS